MIIIDIWLPFDANIFFSLLIYLVVGVMYEH